MARGLVRSTVHGALDVAVNSTKPGEALQTAVVSGTVAGVASTAVGQIGLGKAEGKIDTVTHKVLHGMAGAFMELGGLGVGGLTKKLGGSLLGALQKGASKLGNIAKTQKILPFKEMKLYDVGGGGLSIQASKPVEIYHGYGGLSARQKNLLEAMPEPLDILKTHKSNVNMTDLAALTAKTGDEFAMFSLGKQRMIIRGDKVGVDIRKRILTEIERKGWIWSGHTHPGVGDIVLNASGADRHVLWFLEQERSLIVNSAGRRNVFTKAVDQHITPSTKLE